MLPRLALVIIAVAAPAAAQQRLPAWTRGATCYEIFVRSFYDSDGDGIGDLKGLISKLDYINDGDPRSSRSLGARCIWLMPVAESPSYHGYDVSDYYRVHHEYGTNADFHRLIGAAHRRGIRVLVDMVLNHASAKHPYFQAALRDTSSPYRAWFRWSATEPPDLNPWGQSNWRQSPVRDEWYYAFFCCNMPDLNYSHPPVVAEAKKIARFWLDDMGADGFRLDAIPYLVEEDNRIVHTAGTHALLRDYETYVRSVKPDAFTVGEVSDNTDALVGYYPDQLDSYFAFELADSIVSAVRTGSARGLLLPVLRLQRDVPFGHWSPFLRNHDQPRTRTELGGDMARTRLAALLLLTMPGLPFVYYGEEIGMTGSKPDERLRTPMQWRAAAGAGFTRGTPWARLQDDSLATTVEAQERDPHSLLRFYRRLIHLRAANAALASGKLLPLTTSDAAATAYLRRDGARVVIVIANLSGKPLRNVSLTSVDDVMPPGSFAVRSLLGGISAAPLRATGGRLAGYVPFPVLSPLEGHILEILPNPNPTPTPTPNATPRGPCARGGHMDWRLILQLSH